MAPQATYVSRGRFVFVQRLLNLFPSVFRLEFLTSTSIWFNATHQSTLKPARFPLYTLPKYVTYKSPKKIRAKTGRSFSRKWKFWKGNLLEWPAGWLIVWFQIPRRFEGTHNVHEDWIGSIRPIGPRSITTRILKRFSPGQKVGDVGGGVVLLGISGVWPETVSLNESLVPDFGISFPHGKKNHQSKTSLGFFCNSDLALKDG